MVGKEISMFYPYDRIEFKKEKCEYMWIYHRFKGCIVSERKRGLEFEQKICRKYGKSEFGA